MIVLAFSAWRALSAQRGTGHHPSLRLATSSRPAERGAPPNEVR